MPHPEFPFGSRCARSRFVPLFAFLPHFLFRGARRAQHGRRSSTRQAPNSQSAIHGPSYAHDAQLARLRLRGDVHCRGSALAKAAADSDVDVGGGRPLSRRTRMVVAVDAAAPVPPSTAFGTQWLRVSRPPASRAAPGGQAAAPLSCCGRRGRRLSTSSPSCRRRSHRPNEASDAAIPHAKSGCRRYPPSTLESSGGAAY